ncbi:hypothetical protein HO133_003455 [Letharia lupina]|uniref:Uncharacterized protein n=1 Tax=Letharia lupina TaxID=560253 RepID=A0A8H6FA48_9LECA|nr:uncharacterized protein HO133_003455 [Letharia lupina]KAF6220323.1 hypothetical protein HO133_003455 [Letharia lupina]
MPDAEIGRSATQPAALLWTINTYTTTLSTALQTLSQTNPTALTTAATTSANGTSRFANPTQTLSVDVPLRALLERETYGFALPATPNAGLLAFLETYPAAQTYGSSTSVPELLVLLLQRLGQVLLRIMSDVSSFLTVAERGAFSTGEAVGGAGLVEAWGT